MSRINAQIVIGIRNQLAHYRGRLAGNPSRQQLQEILQNLQLLRQRIEPLVADRRWEALEVSRELDQLRNQVVQRNYGQRPPTGHETYEEQLETAVQLADLLGEQFDDMLASVQSSRMQLRTIDLTGEGRYWLPLYGWNPSVSITLTRYRQEVSDFFGSEQVGPDGGQWFCQISYPQPFSQEAKQALDRHRAWEEAENVIWYDRRQPKHKPQFFWFRQLPGQSGNDDEQQQQHRYQCWWNLHEPWTNRGLIPDHQAPVWFRGPEIQIGSLQHYNRLAAAITRLVDMSRQCLDELNESLATVDLGWRLYRQQLTRATGAATAANKAAPDSNLQQSEQRYRDVMNRLMTVRDRIRRQCQEFCDSGHQQLRLFNTPGGGGLILE